MCLDTLVSEIKRYDYVMHTNYQIGVVPLCSRVVQAAPFPTRDKGCLMICAELELSSGLSLGL